MARKWKTMGTPLAMQGLPRNYLNTINQDLSENMNFGEGITIRITYFSIILPRLFSNTASSSSN